VADPRADEAPATGDAQAAVATNLDDLSIGFLVGLLVGEGHFGGDGVQPQITLRMHVRHERLFRWLAETFPGSRLYGPYEHGGRAYFQWMVRGAYLREVVVPIIAPHLDRLDGHAASRFADMCGRYRIDLARPMPSLADIASTHGRTSRTSSSRGSG
jgi:hypothetical protein